MNKINIQSYEDAIARLEQLFAASNQRDEDLLYYIQQLSTENEQLKLTLYKLRRSKLNSAAASSMHSKLSEALRE